MASYSRKLFLQTKWRTRMMVFAASVTLQEFSSQMDLERFIGLGCWVIHHCQRQWAFLCSMGEANVLPCRLKWLKASFLGDKWLLTVWGVSLLRSPLSDTPSNNKTIRVKAAIHQMYSYYFVNKLIKKQSAAHVVHDQIKGWYRYSVLCNLPVTREHIQ